jgi:hypothetical protein
MHQEYANLLMKKGDYKKEAYENLVVYNSIQGSYRRFWEIKRANIVGVNLELDEYKRKVDTIENEISLQYISLQKSRVIVVLFIIALVLFFTL